MTTDSLPMPDDQDSAPTSDEAVKPKRTRRPKAASTDVTPADAGGDAVTVAADAEPPKRAPRRRKVDTEEEVPVTSEPAERQPEAAEAAQDAPARKRAPRRKAADALPRKVARHVNSALDREPVRTAYPPGRCVRIADHRAFAFEHVPGQARTHVLNALRHLVNPNFLLLESNGGGGYVVVVDRGDVGCV